MTVPTLTDLYATEYGHSESDSMKVLGLGELPPPASCFICGSGNCEAGYLNLGIWVEYVGNALVCIPDMIKMAEKVGCLAPSVNVLLNENMEKLVERNADLTEQNEQLNGKLESYRNILRDSVNADVPLKYAVGGILNTPINQESTTSDDLPKRASVVNDGEESESPESSKVDGPTDLTQSTVRDLTESPSGPSL